MCTSTETSSDQEVLGAVRLLADQFLERAEQTDRGGPLNDLLRENIDQLIRLRFLAANIPVEFGGLGLGRSASRESLKLISGACGVTAFTQQQMHAGGNFISPSKDEDLRRELLPQFASGENICGVGFSHLRRLGPPSVRAVETSEGFTINGVLPWISGWSLLDSFILGATVNDGTMIYCYTSIAEHKAHLTPGKPMQLSVLGASETIELAISDLKIPKRYVLSRNPPDHMVRQDYRGISGHTELPLGCALGSASFLRNLGTKRNQEHLIETAAKIENKASQVEAFADSWNGWNGTRYEDPGYKVNALKARIGAITLAINAASASVTALGGSAHLVSSPAQRRYRESAFYATQAQTLDIQKALLEDFIDG